MANETKLNSGAIFKNDKKTADNHPDYRGKINVDGIDKDISLWVKTSGNGIKYFSASIKEAWVPNSNNQVQAPQVDNDDLPF